jgi:excisionase family DNA binding protein
MDANEKWYSVKEVSAILGVSCDSVIRWIHRKLLKAFQMPSMGSRRKRVYRCYRVSSTDLDRFRRGNMNF